MVATADTFALRYFLVQGIAPLLHPLRGEWPPPAAAYASPFAGLSQNANTENVRDINLLWKNFFPSCHLSPPLPDVHRGFEKSIAGFLLNEQYCD